MGKARTRVSRPLLEGHHKAVGEKHAHLLRLHRIRDLAQDDEQVVLVPVHLGTLGHIQDVLQGEGVETEPVPDGLHDVGVG